MCVCLCVCVCVCVFGYVCVLIHFFILVCGLRERERVLNMVRCCIFFSATVLIMKLKLWDIGSKFTSDHCTIRYTINDLSHIT